MMRLAASLTETRLSRDPGDLPSFPEFSRQIRAEMRQSGLLEGILFDRITASAWRLARLDPAAIPLSRDEQRAERSLHRALEMLESLRASCAESFLRRPGASAPPRPARPAFHPAPEPKEGDEGGLCDSWRERLTFDPKTSDESPVVKGTWITVDHVISLIIDNWSWADILRTHPELCEDDIRACLTYSIEQSQDDTC